MPGASPITLRHLCGQVIELTDSEPEKRKVLSAKLTAWQEKIEAVILEPNPEYVPREGDGGFTLITG